MELKEFIKEVLTEIVSGIEEAKEELNSKGAIVNPSLIKTDANGMYIQDIQGDRRVQEIHFEIMVNTEEGSTGKAGIGILSGAFNLGASASSNDKVNKGNLIKFSVPISLPCTELKRNNTIAY
ncbi:TPA: hypothetical protein JRX92_003467 [Elizabethkingia anophelis]|nr:hypothetical protein [Elizabethkingia anophelis]